MPIRILLVDDHQLMCDGLRLLLERVAGNHVVGTCGDCATAFRLTGELRPDLAILDVDLPDGSGIVLAKRIRGAFPAVKVLVLTAHVQPEFAAAALAAGAGGYLVKTNASAELAGAVATVMAGGIHAGTADRQAAPTVTLPTTRRALPEREGQVLALLLKGLRNKEVAGELNLSVKTVETYRSRLMKRFGVNSMAELVRQAIREGLAPP